MRSKCCKSIPTSLLFRLSAASGRSALEIGLARVSGGIVFHSSYSADASLNLKITPGDAPRAEYVQMRFSSKRSWLRDDGKLVVAGDLSVTRVEHSVTTDPNKAYAGPDHGNPLVHTDTREVTLVFSDPRHVAPQNGVVEFSGTSSVSREVFPEFVDAVAFPAVAARRPSRRFGLAWSEVS